MPILEQSTKKNLMPTICPIASNSRHSQSRKLEELQKFIQEKD